MVHGRRHRRETAHRDDYHPQPSASGCLFVVAAPSGGGKSSLVNALLDARARRSGYRCPTRRDRPARANRRAATTIFVDVNRFLELKRARRISRARVGPRQLVRHIRDLVEAQVAAGQDVLLEIDWQGARAGATAHSGFGPHLHPAAVDRCAARAAAKACPGPGRGDRTAARRRARGDAPLWRIRLCYYESGLCAGCRRPLRHRACGAAHHRPAADTPREGARPTSEPRTHKGHHGPHHHRRLSRKDPQPLRTDARRDQSCPADHLRRGAAGRDRP